MPSVVHPYERKYCGEIHIWERWPTDKPIPQDMKDVPMCGRCAARLARFHTYGTPLLAPLLSNRGGVILSRKV